MSGFIVLAIENKRYIKLDNSLIWSHFDFYVHLWSPYNRKDIAKLERVQRRITTHLPNEERLEELIP